jgi:hypothetical protein
MGTWYHEAGHIALLVAWVLLNLKGIRIGVMSYQTAESVKQRSAYISVLLIYCSTLQGFQSHAHFLGG